VPDASGLGSVSEVHGDDDFGGGYAPGKLILAF